MFFSRLLLSTGGNGSRGAESGFALLIIGSVFGVLAGLVNWFLVLAALRAFFARYEQLHGIRVRIPLPWDSDVFTHGFDVTWLSLLVRRHEHEDLTLLRARVIRRSFGFLVIGLACVGVSMIASTLGGV